MFTRLLLVDRSTTFSVTLRLFNCETCSRSFFSFFYLLMELCPGTFGSLLLGLGLVTQREQHPLLCFHFFTTSPSRLATYSSPATPVLVILLLALFSSLHTLCASPRTPLHVAPHACFIFCNVTTSPRFGSAPRHATFHLSVPRAAPQDSQHSAPERRKEKQKVDVIPHTALQHSLPHHNAEGPRNHHTMAVRVTGTFVKICPVSDRAMARKVLFASAVAVSVEAFVPADTYQFQDFVQDFGRQYG